MSGENDPTLMLAPPPPLRALATLADAYALATLQLGKVVARDGRLAEAESLDREGLASLRNFVERGDHRIEEAEQQLAEVVRAEAAPASPYGKLIVGSDP